MAEPETMTNAVTHGQGEGIWTSMFVHPFFKKDGLDQDKERQKQTTQGEHRRGNTH